MPQPGTRLVTQNLLASASACVNAPDVTWNALQDLCTLIDLFCLYDRLIILGRQAYELYLSNRSEFGSALREAVTIDEFQRDDRTIQAACAHFGAFVEEVDDTTKFEPLFTAILTPDAIARSFSQDPDTERGVEEAKLWFRTLPTGSDIVNALERDRDYHRPVTFLARSFLYLAHADANRIPLTSDCTRAPIFQGAIQTERNLRQRLLAKLNQQSEDRILTDDFSGRELTRQISSLASIVFERAYPDRKNIAKHLLQLRAELMPLRARIRSAEDRALWRNKAEEIDAANDWQKVFDEIERLFGKGERLVTLSSVLGFAEGAVGAYLKPEDAKGWFKLPELPLTVLQRLLARRSVIELYQLRDEIPASGRLSQTIGRLFGNHLH